MPAARDLHIIFNVDVLARHTGPRVVHDTVRATLHDAGHREIGRGGTSCCYFHAARSLARAVRKERIYADAPPAYDAAPPAFDDAPPPYWRSESPEGECSV
jgi:hypothetical protein